MLNVIVFGDRAYSDGEYVAKLIQTLKHVEVQVTLLVQSRGPGSAARHYIGRLRCGQRTVSVRYQGENPTVTAAAECVVADHPNMAISFGDDAVARKVRAYFESQRVLCVQAPLDLTLPELPQGYNESDFPEEEDDECFSDDMDEACGCRPCRHARGELD